MSRRRDCIIFVILALVGIVVNYPTWNKLLATNPLYYTNDPFPVVSPVGAGDSLFVRLTRCNSSTHDIIVRVTRNLIRLDSNPQQTAVLPGAGTVLSPGCETIDSTLVTIPAETTPGKYEIRGLSSVTNRGVEFTVPWRTQAFEVVQ